MFRKLLVSFLLRVCSPFCGGVYLLHVSQTTTTHCATTPKSSSTLFTRWRVTIWYAAKRTVCMFGCSFCLSMTLFAFQVNKLRYPEGIAVLHYDPSFAIRGLTIDIEKGLLCKISSHQKLSYSGVFRGRQRLSRDEIMKLYGGSRHVSVHHRDKKMEPLNDLFSVAHACLFADVVQYLIDADIEYEPIAIVEDVRDAIAQVHVSGRMHKVVAQDLPKYIEPNPMLLPLLERIRVRPLDAVRTPWCICSRGPVLTSRSFDTLAEIRQENVYLYKQLVPVHRCRSQVHDRR